MGSAALFTLCLLGLLAAAAGSPGDQSWAFRQCTSVCQRTGCASLSLAGAAGAAGAAGGKQHCSVLCRKPNSSSSSSSMNGGIDGSGLQGPPPLALRLWRWDCAADCAYLCMWQVEGSRPAGTAVQKYYGKWPFVRLLGMQEPASVLFSLLNLAAHVLCLVRFRRLCRTQRRQQRLLPKSSHVEAAAGDGRGSSSSGGLSSPAGSAAWAHNTHALAATAVSPPSPYPYAWLWAGYMLLSINAWLWSAVFHSRDTRLTERLDYFSAATLIFFNLFLSVVRVGRLRSRVAQAAVAAPLLLFLASHFRFMLLVLFDYGYHVKVCIVAGAAQSLLWLLWAVASAPPPPGRRPLLSFILFVNTCMALEVLDFPPIWRVLDAHSLWHAATVPLVYLFYRFIQADLTAGWGTADAKSKLM